MEDKQLPCIDQGKNPECEGTFTFTAGEQDFYEKKAYTPPKRCPACRKIKKIKFADQDRRRPPYDGGFNNGQD